jgi:hypothetical protein
MRENTSTRPLGPAWGLPWILRGLAVIDFVAMDTLEVEPLAGRSGRAG